MSVVFCVRGDSKVARKSGNTAPSGATPAEVGTVSTGAGDIGGIIDLGYGSFGQHTLIYRGNGNLPSTQKISVMFRFRMSSAADVNQLFYIGGPASNWGLQCRYSGANQLVTTVSQITTGASLATQTAAWTPSTNTYYDVGISFDGTATTNALKSYVDGSLLAQTTTSATRAALDAAMTSSTFIMVGAQNSTAQFQTAISLSELIMFDTAEDFTGTYTLTTGTGTFNGASRTYWLDVTASDLADTDPGVANVKSGTSYMYGGSSKTGTYVAPAGGAFGFVG